MARPKDFHEAAALDAAVNCFWDRGFAATSVRNLADHMGISGPSLYNAFGDKRSLFVQALERYLDLTLRQRIERLEKDHPPKAAILAFIADAVDRSLKDRKRRGCLLVNSAIEIAPHNAKLGGEIAERLDEIRAFFHRNIKAAQADGGIPRERDPDDLARMLLGLVLGIRVLARSNPDRKLLEGVLRPALALLDWPTSPRGSRSRQQIRNISPRSRMRSSVPSIQANTRS